MTHDGWNGHDWLENKIRDTVRRKCTVATSISTIVAQSFCCFVVVDVCCCGCCGCFGQLYYRTSYVVMANNPPPAVGDPNANNTLDHVFGMGHPNGSARVGRSSKRLKTAQDLHNAGTVTDQELGQQEVFHLQQTISNLPPGAAIPGAPAWFGQAMAAALAPINNTLVNIQARQMNATTQDALDQIIPLQDNAGNVAPNFPVTRRGLENLTNPQLAALLAFYGLPANPAATRRNRFKQFIGIRP